MNLLEKQDNECLLVSIQDVRDSLWWSFLTLSDSEINILIIKSQDEIIKYIHKLNPNTSCNPCDYIECEEIINIQRAIILYIQDYYNLANQESSSASLWDIKSETTACWVKLEYVVATILEVKTSATEIHNLLSCFELTGANRSLCWTPCKTDCECPNTL